MKVIKFNHLEENVILYHAGQKFEVPYYRADTEKDIKNDTRFTYVFYFQGIEYVYSHINYYPFGAKNKGTMKIARFLTTADVFCQNPECYRNIKVGYGYEYGINERFVVTGDSYDGRKNVSLYESDSYMACLIYMSGCMEMPEMSFFLVFADGKEELYDDVESMIDSALRYDAEKVGIKLIYDNRLDYECIIAGKQERNYVLNGDISKSPVATNCETICALNYIVRMLDINNVEFFNGRKNVSMEINRWNQHFFEENNSMKIVQGMRSERRKRR